MPITTTSPGRSRCNRSSPVSTLGIAMRSPCAASTGPRAYAARRGVFSFAAAPPSADPGRVRRLRSGHGRTVPLPQPRLSGADSARAVLEPSRLGCERLGLRRPQRQPRVRGLGCERHSDRRGHGPAIRAKSSRFPATARRGARSRSIRSSTPARIDGAPTRTCRRRPQQRDPNDRHVGVAADGGLASTNIDTSSQHTLYVSNIDYATTPRCPAWPPLYLSPAATRPALVASLQPGEPAPPQFLSSASTPGYMPTRQAWSVTDARTARCAPGHKPSEVLVDYNVVRCSSGMCADGCTRSSAPRPPDDRYIHSRSPTANGSHLIFHASSKGYSSRCQRTSHLASRNINSPRMRVRHAGATQTTDHNGYRRGRAAASRIVRAASSSTALRIPTRCFEIAHFDNASLPAPTSPGTDGAWGSPVSAVGDLRVSDIELRPLRVVRPDAEARFGQRTARLRRVVADVDGEPRARSM